MADYPPSDDRLRHLIAQEINPHVTSWKLAFFIADGIVTSRAVRGELKRVAEVHAAGEHCGDRNCEHCWNAITAAEAQQPEPPADPWSVSYHRLGPAKNNPAVCTCGLGPEAILHNEPPHAFNGRPKPGMPPVYGICTDCHHHESAACHVTQEAASGVTRKP